MSELKLESPKGGRLIVEGDFSGLSPEDKLTWVTWLRTRREAECFSICDRAVWFYGLSDKRKAEVQQWRQAWLDATETGTIPEAPA